MTIQLADIKQDIERAVKDALKEDIQDGDITAKLIPVNQKNTASIITREDCTFCGQAWLDEVFVQVGGIDKIAWHVHDGEKVSANTKLVSLEGNTRSLLTGERTALNFLQLLSGTATKSAQYAEQTKGSSLRILDTRKTIPGLRSAQKYAVTMGGCDNHRIGLFDAFLIKENHIAACDGITQAIATAKSMNLNKPIIIEVETPDEYEKAVIAGADVIMLDNFDEQTLSDTLDKHDDDNITCEVTGDISLEKLKNITTNKPIRVSVGDITKNIRAIDLSFRLES